MHSVILKKALRECSECISLKYNAGEWGASQSREVQEIRKSKGVKINSALGVD